MSSAALAFYRSATRLLTPLARTFLSHRARRGKEDLARLGERLGRASIVRPNGPLIWLHGASIGEALSLLPLIARLNARGFATLLTTGTQTSAQALTRRLLSGTIHQYAPLDLPAAMRAFLDHWRPSLLLLCESEIWPNMLTACTARRIAVAVVNARISERSTARWQRVPKTARTLFGTPAVTFAQTSSDAARFTALGAREALVCGNLKYDRAPPPCDPIELARWQAQIAGRPVVLIASSHESDNDPILRAHRALRDHHPDLLTIIAPRDIAQAPTITDAAVRAGLSVMRRTEQRTMTQDVDVLVADTIGEMGLWLRLASVAVIGKTFAPPGGGQTPIEAAQCGAAILHGPYVANFADVFGALDAASAARATTEAHLEYDIEALLADPKSRRDMARTAAGVVDRLRGATDRTMLALEPLLQSSLADRPRS